MHLQEKFNIVLNLDLFQRIVKRKFDRFSRFQVTLSLDSNTLRRRCRLEWHCRELTEYSTRAAFEFPILTIDPRTILRKIRLIFPVLFVRRVVILPTDTKLPLIYEKSNRICFLILQKPKQSNQFKNL